MLKLRNFGEKSIVKKIKKNADFSKKKKNAFFSNARNFEEK